MTHQDAAVLREGGDRLCKQSEAQPTSNCILSTVSLNSSELELYLVIISVRLSCTTSEICVEKRGGRGRGGQTPARFSKTKTSVNFCTNLVSEDISSDGCSKLNEDDQTQKDGKLRRKKSDDQQLLW